MQCTLRLTTKTEEKKLGKGVGLQTSLVLCSTKGYIQAQDGKDVKTARTFSHLQLRFAYFDIKLN